MDVESTTKLPLGPTRILNWTQTVTRGYTVNWKHGCKNICEIHAHLVLGILAFLDKSTNLHPTRLYNQLIRYLWYCSIIEYTLNIGEWLKLTESESCWGFPHDFSCKPDTSQASSPPYFPSTCLSRTTFPKLRMLASTVWILLFCWKSPKLSIIFYYYLYRYFTFSNDLFFQQINEAKFSSRAHWTFYKW